MSRAAAALLPLLAACRAWTLPPPEPWAAPRPGAVAVGLRPALFTLYGIDGVFDADTPAKGPLTAVDDGDLSGRFGLAARVEVCLRPELFAFVAADYRVYDIEGLEPIPELHVSIETVDSLQYTAGLRYLFPPLGRAPRVRPWCELGLSYLPEVDVEFEVDLSRFGSSNLEIETTAEGGWMAGGGVGLAYRWTDRVALELGVVYEVPLSPLDSDLSFSIGASEVPMRGDLEPQGLIGFLGLSVTL